jgi:beta-aspartyl-dipeptidase (metallo-type)
VPKVKGLKEEGLNAFMWSGGYSVPPACITESIKSDMMFIEEVIGVGEIAIADDRSSEPDTGELARLASDAYVSGTLAKKAGLVHVHVGDKPAGLSVIKETLNDKGIKPEWFYLTHINRSENLMLEAIELAKKGSFVDIDTVDEDLTDKLTFYLENGGPAGQLTISSDASLTSPQNLFNQIRACIREAGFEIESILPLVTKNTARALKLDMKGRVAAGKIADVLVIEKSNFELREVFSKGRRLLRKGRPERTEKFLEESNRTIVLKGLAQQGAGS